MKRRLRALRFILTPKLPRPTLTAIVVRRDGPQVEAFPDPKPACDLRAGDWVIHSGTARQIVRVEIADADPRSEIGQAVESGRAWLAGAGGSEKPEPAE